MNATTNPQSPREVKIGPGHYVIAGFDVIKCANLIPGSSFRGWRAYERPRSEKTLPLVELPTLTEVRAWCEGPNSRPCKNVGNFAVRSDGSCLRCGADQGEACRPPQGHGQSGDRE